MYITRRIGFAVIGALWSLTAAYPAAATVIYDWTGTCNFGCTGTATATLTLDSLYVPGTALLFADFVSLTYTSGCFLSFDRGHAPRVIRLVCRRGGHRSCGSEYFLFRANRWRLGVEIPPLWAGP